MLSSASMITLAKRLAFLMVLAVVSACQGPQSSLSTIPTPKFSPGQDAEALAAVDGQTGIRIAVTAEEIQRARTIEAARQGGEPRDPDEPVLASVAARMVSRPAPRPALNASFAPTGRKPNFFERAAMRKAKYAPIVAKYARKHGVPPKLAIAIVQIESSFRPKATGSVGEIGLMQVRPRTARGMGYTGTNAALYDPETNVRMGMKYLAEAHRRGGGTVCGTILKYNAGHYAKRMNPVSARYCKRVKRLMVINDPPTET